MNTKNILINMCLNSDSYKASHFKFMKIGTTSVFSYVEPRTGSKFPAVMLFGIQMYLKNYLRKRVTQRMIDQADTFLTAHGLPFNRVGWEYIVNNHNGYLPLRIRAVPEGTVVPVNNVILTVENTDPNCAWASAWIETAFLRAAWYGTTVATQSFEYKKIISKYLEKSGDASTVNFKLVDFGARGVSSFESDYIAGAAHLVNFNVTDNLIGIAGTMEFYGEKEVTAFSIPASEHSVTTERGRHGELEFFSDAIDNFLGGPGEGTGKMVSLVLDTYSTMNAIKLLGVDLKDKIIATGGTVVGRPDSGVPADSVLAVVQEFEKYFGTTLNDKGYKVLHPSVRVIQGDGITIDSVESIYEKLLANGYSADNLTLGSGGGLLQNVTRDTQRFAMKASHVVIDGVGTDIQKIPETDMTKASKAGRLALVKRNGEYATIREEDMTKGEKNLLKIVYENGKLKNTQTFAQIRKLADSQVA